MEVKMTKYSIELNKEFDNLLNQISERKGLTKAEIIRRAVASYDFLDKELSSTQDKKLIIRDNENNITNIKLP